MGVSYVSSLFSLFSTTLGSGSGAYGGLRTE